MLLLEMEMFVTEIKVNQVVSVSGYPLYCLHDAMLWSVFIIYVIDFPQFHNIYV